mmetsp:Transcript_38336/g.80666  ORF Transcript_38336/g.80666 Transcript_38336/m.80666 type:complete len:927 (+) Transcript_38336:361-3141(+)|eukprot:CAMPEP_0183731096 /NCGR_PEP_ID=MMETSP0737-20130205/34419_1 /TAXON_ID=385413 /ORGANISM="Thalassiosira miniscula, Strain CCMP1093" /LENGTH=926 /DNA_ID=CAMNT_0025963747 /DNA_START=353 /DNA_END=3133 /DNA_ORIENTATION=-
MFKKIKAIGKKKDGELDESEQRRRGQVDFAPQEKDPRGGSDSRGEKMEGSGHRKKERSGDRDRSERRDRDGRSERKSSDHRKSERKSTRKSVKYKIDEDGNKVPIPREDREREREKAKRRGSGKKDATDREKKIAMHAKAKREAEKRRNTTDEMKDMSLDDGTKDYEPGLKVEVKGKGFTDGGSTSVHAQRFDNIYAAPQEMVSNFVAPVYEKSDDDVEFLLDALADNFVFNTLDETELETLVNAFENYECNQGDTIIKQGETGGHFYILRSGKVAFVVDGNEVGRAVPGNSFGELALLYNAPRAATCMAVDGKAGLWRVNQVTFRKLLAAHTIQNDNQTKDVLRKVPFLSDLDDEFIHRIADALTTVYYDAGDKIFERGSEGSVFYVIREGKVEYEHRKRGIKVLGPGDYFGEQAIVKNEPRKADATAKRDTIALALSREVFEKVLGPLSEVIARSNDRRLLRSVPLFANSDIENFEIELMGALIDEVKYQAEREILTEGDYVDAPALYLVRSGVLEAYTDDGESRILKSGTFFGEDTLMPDEDQKYGGKGGMKQSRETIEVLEDCVLGKLTLANIDSVILDLSRMGNKKGKGRDTLDRSIEIDKLERHTLLGAGTFGQVWLASDRKTGKAYALKVQIKRELIDHHQAEGVCREREVMSKIDHPFVIKLVNTSQDHQSVFMLLNLVQGGELFNVMHNDERDCIPEKEVKFYAAGILEGLAYMHRRRIIYRDLKPENVLIDDLGYTVIVDLGFAKVVNDKTYTLCGTPLYLAPEVILSRGHDKGADYWSLGCLMYEMILGQTPFYDHNIDQITLFKRIVHGRYRFPSHAFSQEAQDLIAAMLANKLTQRLGCLAQGERDIKDHPFMGDINFGKLGKRMLKAPWVPVLRDPLDASCFESWDHLDDKETTGDYKPLSKKEQSIFKEFS